MEIKDPQLAEQVERWRSEHKPGPKIFQRRYAEYEMRLDFDKGAPKMIGYAAVFNQKTELWPGFYEQVAPGAFSKSIEKDDVRALWNHNPDYILGRTKSGTLSLNEDDKGLRYEIIPPDTIWAKDLITLIKRKDISQSSFGFNIIEQSLKNEKRGRQVTRTLNEVQLFDVSPVTFPAYSKTEVHVRTMTGQNETVYCFEDSGEVIVLPTEEVRNEAPLPTDEELIARYVDLKKQIYGS